MVNAANGTSAKGAKLSVIALFSLTFSSMMGSGVFDIPQNIASRSGALAVVLHWFIVALGMLMLAWTFVYLSTKRPEIKSGIYGYAKFGFGDYVGFSSAWGYWLNALLGDASYLIYIFATLGNFLPCFGYAATAGVTLPAFIGESAAIWLIFALMTYGIKESALVNIVITTLKLFALAAILLVFIFGFNYQLFLTNLTASSAQFGSMLQQIKATMLVTVWDFLGLEAACIYAIYARSMQDVAKATMTALIAVLIIDILISCLPFGIMTTAQVQGLATPSTAGAMAMLVGPVSADFIRLVVIICVLGALLAWQMLAVNILFVAAQDRTMPQFLSKLNSKGVPVNAALSSSVVLQLFTCAAYVTKALYLNMIMLATSLVLVPYLFAAMYAFKLIITQRKIYYYELIKGSLAVIYALWMIYAGGLKYLALSTLLYFVGIFVFAQARYEARRRLFDTRLEMFMAGLVMLIALIAGYSWYSGKLDL